MAITWLVVTIRHNLIDRGEMDIKIVRGASMKIRRFQGTAFWAWGSRTVPGGDIRSFACNWRPEVYPVGNIIVMRCRYEMKRPVP